MPARPQDLRFANIDALRFVAAFLVIWAHTAEIALGLAASASGLDTVLAEFARQTNLGRIGVVAYFCVSGYLIPMTIRGQGWRHAASFAIRRTARIYPAYWLSLLAIIVTLNLTSDRQFSAGTILASVTMLPHLFGSSLIMGHYWTLEVEFAFYVLCILLLIGGAIRSPYALWWISSALVAAALFPGAILLRALPSFDATAIGAIKTTLLSLGLMCWAAALRLAFEQPVSRALRVAVIASGALYAIVGPLFGLLAMIKHGGALPISDYLLGNGLGVMLFLLALRIRRVPRAILPLGRASYSFYLFHPVPLYMLPTAAAAGAFDYFGGLSVIGAIALVAAVTFLIAAAMYRWVEQPFITWGHRRAKEIELGEVRLAIASAVRPASFDRPRKLNRNCR